MNHLVLLNATNVPALVVAAGERAQTRIWEFFVSNIRNSHTRRAYGRSIEEFLAWCEQHGLASIIAVEPLHVGTYIEAVTCSHSAPTAKQKLAAIRLPFDWLVTRQIVPTNPAASVRGAFANPAGRNCKGSRPCDDVSRLNRDHQTSTGA